jgi:hypothetical protein
MALPNAFKNDFAMAVAGNERIAGYGAPAQTIADRQPRGLGVILKKPGMLRRREPPPSESPAALAAAATKDLIINFEDKPVAAMLFARHLLLGRCKARLARHPTNYPAKRIAAKTLPASA